jgi:tRNA nucleotidyltransferase (CCA-adding enzyme)
MKANQSPKSVYQQLVRSEEATELSWVLATLTPWVEIPTPDAKKPGGKLPLPYATLVAREGIKVNNRTGEVVTAAFRHLDEITKFQRATASGEAWVKERDNLGMAIRRWEERGGHWKIQVIFAILVDCMRADFPGGKSRSVYLCNFQLIVAAGHGMIIAGWQQLLDHFDDMGVMDAPSWKPLVDGKILSQSLGVKPGVWMKDALNVCMAWQFRNPEVTDRTAAVEEVRARAKELNIPL